MNPSSKSKVPAAKRSADIYQPATDTVMENKTESRSTSAGSRRLTVEMLSDTGSRLSSPVERNLIEIPGALQQRDMVNSQQGVKPKEKHTQKIANVSRKTDGMQKQDSTETIFEECEQPVTSLDGTHQEVYRGHISYLSGQYDAITGRLPRDTSSDQTELARDSSKAASGISQQASIDHSAVSKSSHSSHRGSLRSLQSRKSGHHHPPFLAQPHTMDTSTPSRPAEAAAAQTSASLEVSPWSLSKSARSSGTNMSRRQHSSNTTQDHNLSVQSEGLVCRICHEGDGHEVLVSPCYCAGSVGLLHVSCLQRWLGSSNKTTCEICNFKFSVSRRTMPVKEFFKDPGSSRDKKNLIVDTVSFFLITPLSIVVLWISFHGAFNNYKDTQVERVGLISLACALILLYIVWITFAGRHTWRLWQDWKMFHQEVTLLCTPMAVKRYRSLPSLQQTSADASVSLGSKASSVKLQSIKVSVHGPITQNKAAKKKHRKRSPQKNLPSAMPARERMMREVPGICRELQSGEASEVSQPRTASLHSTSTQEPGTHRKYWPEEAFKINQPIMSSPYSTGTQEPGTHRKYWPEEAFKINQPLISSPYSTGTQEPGTHRKYQPEETSEINQPLISSPYSTGTQEPGTHREYQSRETSMENQPGTSSPYSTQSGSKSSTQREQLPYRQQTSPRHSGDSSPRNVEHPEQGNISREEDATARYRVSENLPQQISLQEYLLRQIQEETDRHPDVESSQKAQHALNSMSGSDHDSLRQRQEQTGGHTNVESSQRSQHALESKNELVHDSNISDVKREDSAKPHAGTADKYLYDNQIASHDAYHKGRSSSVESEDYTTKWVNDHNKQKERYDLKPKYSKERHSAMEEYVSQGFVLALGKSSSSILSSSSAGKAGSGSKPRKATPKDKANNAQVTNVHSYNMQQDDRSNSCKVQGFDSQLPDVQYTIEEGDPPSTTSEQQLLNKGNGFSVYV